MTHSLVLSCRAAIARVNIKSLPKFSVRVGVPGLVHHVDHVDHRGDVGESHVVIVVLKELFLAA